MAPSVFEDPHIVSPTAVHTHTVIALHGRGSQGPEFAEELFENKTSSGLDLQQSFPSWKWIFPSSQERYSTVFREEMDEWFDIYSLTDPTQREELQVEGIRDSVTYLRDIVREEADIVTSERVILLGLSQGSATGILTLLASQIQIGAYVGLSGWMPFKTQIEEIISSSRKPEDLTKFFNATFGVVSSDATPAQGQSCLDTPVFLGHTTDDEVIDVELGRQSVTVLEIMGMKVTWKEFLDGGHSGFLDTEGLDDIVAFLTKATALH